MIGSISVPKLQFLGSSVQDSLGFVTEQGDFILHIGYTTVLRPSKRLFYLMLKESDNIEQIYEDFVHCIFIQVFWESNVLEAMRAKFRIMSTNMTMFERRDMLEKVYVDFMKLVHPNAKSESELLNIDEDACNYLYDTLIGLCKSIRSQSSMFFQ